MKAYQYVRYILSLEIYLSIVGDPINHFNPAKLCACPKQGPEFLMSYIVVLLYEMFNEMMANVLPLLYCSTVTSNRKADSLSFKTNNLFVDLS